MNNNLLFAATIILAWSSPHAQRINYKTSFEKAKTTGPGQQKPVAILMMIDLPATKMMPFYCLMASDKLAWS